MLSILCYLYLIYLSNKRLIIYKCTLFSPISHTRTQGVNKIPLQYDTNKGEVTTHLKKHQGTHTTASIGMDDG